MTFTSEPASHMQKLGNTAMAVGIVAVLYATLTGKEAPALADQNRLIAILAIIALTLSAGCGLAAWRADAGMGL